MANKRTLKRNINLFCGDLFAECLAASLYGQNKDSAKALIFSTLKMQDDFIRRISHPEPGMPQKKYFQRLKEDFVARASEIADQVNY